MAQKELSLFGQSFKTVRDHYKMKRKFFNQNIEKIRPELDKIAGRKKYNNLLPEQVELIIKQIEGGK